MVFTINNVSYADHCIAGTYKVNSKDITENWVDASGKSHRRLKRKKVSGTVDMFFRTLDEFNSFISNIETNKTSTLSNAMKVTVNNMNEDKQIDAFIDFEPVRDRDGMWNDYMLRYTLTIEER